MTLPIRVCIVEDDPMVAELNRRYVSRVPDFVCAGVTHSAKEALHFLSSHQIDLLLLDIYMPDTDGLAFLSVLRKSHMQTDVIVLTAARDVRTVEESLRLGAIDYLVKPFEFERLQAALEVYRRRRNVAHSTESLSQEQIDRFIFNRDIAVDAPKGLDRDTLQMCMRTLQSFTLGQEVTADEFAHRLGVSRVTARRYLEYLAANDYLARGHQYGAVGRPVRVYRLVEQPRGDSQ